MKCKFCGKEDTVALHEVLNRGWVMECNNCRRRGMLLPYPTEAKRFWDEWEVSNGND